MPSFQAAPFVLGILVGLVLGLLVYGLFRVRSSKEGDILVVLLALACFALGVFITYALALVWGF